MSTHVDVARTTPAAADPDPEGVEVFAGAMMETLGHGFAALMISVGHQVGLFDVMAAAPPSTSTQLAQRAGLDERYVREWLGTLTTARVVDHDRASDTYGLPPEHAAVLTRAAGPDNLAPYMQFIPLLAQVESRIVDCFREGGGLPYAAYEQFHGLMAELSGATHDGVLLDEVVPLVPGLAERLAQGMRVADIGCGQGHALNLLAREYPDSTFVGYDFEAQAIDAARAEAEAWGLGNVAFERKDVADLAGTGTFGLVTAFDAIHDQARPRDVLAEVAAHLDPDDGVFLMVDVRLSSDVDDNVGVPHAPMMYTISTMHCMSVSLGQDGEGLGAAWGEQLAGELLAQAGFADVRLETIDADPINGYYVCRR